MRKLNLIEDMNRPWGGYKVFADNETCTTKLLFVNPGEILSLQKHKKRNETWYVISGKAKVTNSPYLDHLNEFTLEKDEGCYIHKENYHRLENVGKEELIILEIMTGIYEEDDIERFEDKYGRK